MRMPLEIFDLLFHLPWLLLLLPNSPYTLPQVPELRQLLTSRQRLSVKQMMTILLVHQPRSVSPRNSNPIFATSRDEPLHPCHRALKVSDRYHPDSQSHNRNRLPAIDLRSDQQYRPVCPSMRLHRERLLLHANPQWYRQPRDL